VSSPERVPGAIVVELPAPHLEALGDVARPTAIAESALVSVFMAVRALRVRDRPIARPDRAVDRGEERAAGNAVT
jgi:hypothetical protein